MSRQHHHAPVLHSGCVLVASRSVPVSPSRLRPGRTGTLQVIDFMGVPVASRSNVSVCPVPVVPVDCNPLKSLRPGCVSVPYTYSPLKGGDRYLPMAGCRLMGDQPYFQARFEDTQRIKLQLRRLERMTSLPSRVVAYRFMDVGTT